VVRRRRATAEDRGRSGRARRHRQPDGGGQPRHCGRIITASINLGIKGTPLSVVGRNAGSGQIELVDILLRMGQVLDEQNIPEVGRWVVMPAWAGRMIKQSELRQAYLSGDSVSMLRNGRLGMVDRFTIYISNLLPNNSTDSTNFSSGEWPIFAGHAHGLTFASQISKNRDAKIRIDLRSNLARSSSIRLSSS
jgi:hypothetical protein